MICTAEYRFILTLSVATALCVCWQAKSPADDNSEFFEKRIRPILVDRCESCHSAANSKTSGNLALDTRDGWQKGGDSGTAVVPGMPEDSLLIQAVRYADDGPQMPPTEKGGKLTETEIELLVEWVRRGAPDTRTAVARIGGMTPDEAQQWWAFQPVQSKVPQAVKETAWPRTEIDRFILAELEQRGLAHAAQADKRALIRRATFDLTGLPPSSDEINAFLRDESPGAFDTVVNALLESPAYGERWARHWLDVVRYADYYQANPRGHGSNDKFELHEAYRYRDWVVQSLQGDLPYDQFITHQIAGDRLPNPKGEAVYADGLIASGFLSLGSWDHGDADKDKIISDIVDDQIDVIGRAFLGLTLSCARCHAHKFDPISHEDYYALAGIFYSTRTLEHVGTKGDHTILHRAPLVSDLQVRNRDRQMQQLYENQLEQLKTFGATDVAGAPSTPPPADDATKARLAALVAERDNILKALIPPIPIAIAVMDGGTPGGLFPGIQDVPLHLRGSYTKLGPVIPRRLPTFFAGESQPPVTSGSGRLEFARWIANPSNPLTARVIVNRVWQHHFGKGMVGTPNNFGKLGDAPSHPELLDWLADQFVQSGWSLKSLHRLIMRSAVYQQASHSTPEYREKDSENRWLGYANVRRLEAEAIRDSLLFVSGRLDRTLGGPATADVVQLRRSLYVQTTRWDRSNFSTLFDAANPDQPVEQRTVSTVAPQALFLLNHPFVIDQAKHLSERARMATSGNDEATIRQMHEWLYGRSASDDEVQVGQKLLATWASLGPEAAWAEYAHVLLCANEFIYID